MPSRSPGTLLTAAIDSQPAAGAEAGPRGMSATTLAYRGMGATTPERVTPPSVLAAVRYGSGVPGSTTKHGSATIISGSRN